MTVDQLKEHLERFPGYWPVGVEVTVDDPEDGFATRRRSAAVEAIASMEDSLYGNHSTMVVIR